MIVEDLENCAIRSDGISTLVFKGLMGYKYYYMEVNRMKKKWVFIVVFVLGFHWIISGTPAQAQKPLNTLDLILLHPPTLTLLYSNNISGEIDPCPT